MKHNDFEITGLVSNVKFKYTDGGTAIADICISKTNPRAKGEEDKWMPLWITMYGKAAENFNDNIQKGDNANVTGKVEVETFQKDGKTVHKLVLKGWESQRVEYDKDAKDYKPAPKQRQTKIEETKPWD